MAAKPSHDIVGAMAGMAIGGSLAFTVLLVSIMIFICGPKSRTLNNYFFVGTLVTGSAALVAGPVFLLAFILAFPVVGAAVGFVIGLDAAQEAHSVYDALIRAIACNFEMAKRVTDNAHQFKVKADKYVKLYRPKISKVIEV